MFNPDKLIRACQIFPDTLILQFGRAADVLAAGVQSNARMLRTMGASAERADVEGRNRIARVGLPGHGETTKAPAFDHSRPVGIHNLPPLEQLRFTAIGHNNVFLVAYDSKPIGYYKWRPNAKHTKNEAHAYDASLLLGLDIVPPTKTFNGPLGPGSFQEHVPNRGEFTATRSAAGQEIAVFDYIMAHADRISANALARIHPPGKIAAIDNELILQERAPGRNGNIIVSGFVTDNLNQPLDADLVRTLRQVDAADFSRNLQAMGYSRDVSDWSAQRLTEIQREGMITGRSWDGLIIRPDERPTYLPVQGEFYD